MERDVRHTPDEGASLLRTQGLPHSSDRIPEKARVFFDPEQPITWPIYQDKLKQELNAIVNYCAYLPFHIEEAEKSDSSLQMRGHFEAYDGARIVVTLSGEYGDPEKCKFMDKLSAEDSFAKVKIEAVLENAEGSQRKIFKNIAMRESWIRFSEEPATYTYGEGRYDENSVAGLANIRRLGKAVMLYNEAHIKGVAENVVEQQRVFASKMEDLGLSLRGNRVQVKTEIIEFELSGDANPAMRMMNNRYLEFKGGIRLSADFRLDSTASDDKTALAPADMIDFADASCKWIDVTYTPFGDRWTFRISSPFFNKVIYKCTKPRTKFDDNLTWLKDVSRFIIGSMQTYVYDPRCGFDDFAARSFSNYISAAQEQILKEDSSYQPLVRPIAESPEYTEGGSLLLKSGVSYRMLDRMMKMVIEACASQKQLSVKDLMDDRELQARLAEDPVLKVQVEAYYKCFQKDPERAIVNFQDLDPARKLADELYEKATEDK